MIELPERGGIEGDGTLGFAVHPYRDVPLLDGGDGAKIAVGKPKLFIGRGHLDAVAGGELTLCFTEDVDAP